MSERIRVGMVGAGRVADVHYEALKSCGEMAKLVAFCDVREEALAERAPAWKVPGFRNLEDMLDAVQIDAAVVLLPHDAHLAAMQQLLARKVPVLLEKPLALNLEEADEIVRLAEESAVPVLVGHNGLYHPAFARMLQWIEEGKIGRPLFGIAKSLQWLFFKPWDFRLRRAQTGGGAWVDCAGHLLYRLNAVFGEIDTVFGVTSHLARAEMEGEDTAAAVLRYRSGPIAQVMVSYGCKLPGYEKDWPSGCEQVIQVTGDLGGVEYHICPRPMLRVFSDSQAPAEGWTEESIAEPFEVSFDLQMRHFLECVQGRTTARVPPREARDLLAVLLKLYQNDHPGMGSPS